MKVKNRLHISTSLYLSQISLICESKTCRSKNNQASVTCWSPGCTFLTGNRAIRFCDACHTLRHSYGQTSTGQEGSDTIQPTEPIVDASSRITPGGRRPTHPGFHAYQVNRLSKNGGMFIVSVLRFSACLSQFVSLYTFISSFRSV